MIVFSFFLFVGESGSSHQPSLLQTHSAAFSSRRARLFSADRPVFHRYPVRPFTVYRMPGAAASLSGFFIFSLLSFLPGL